MIVFPLIWKARISAAIPEDTCPVTQQAFPKGNISMQIRDHFGMLYQNP